jgi:hypothetical protein
VVLANRWNDTPGSSRSAVSKSYPPDCRGIIIVGADLVMATPDA